MKLINKILISTLIIICISLSSSIKIEKKPEPLNKRKNKIKDLKSNTRFFSNSNFTLSINNEIVNSKSVAKVSHGFIREYELPSINNNDEVTLSFEKPTEEVVVAGFFQVDGYRFSTGAEWKCSSGSSEVTSSRNEYALFESKNVYCALSAGSSLVISSKVSLKPIGKIAFVIENYLVDIKVNEFSIPYPGPGDSNQQRVIETTLQAGDKIQICGKDDTIRDAFFTASIYFEGNVIDTDGSWSCNGKSAVIKRKNKDLKSNLSDVKVTENLIRSNALPIWDGTIGKVDRVVCCSKTLTKQNPLEIEENYVIKSDLKNKCFIAKKGSKFDLDELTNSRLVILSNEVNIDMITVDGNPKTYSRIMNNIELKLGSKLTISISRKDKEKDLKIAFAAYIKVYGYTYVCYSSNSTFKPTVASKLDVFDTFTQDFGDLIPKNAQYIGIMTGDSETITGELNFDKTDSIYFVVDDFVTSLKVNGKDIPFTAEKDEWTYLRSAERLNLFSGDKVEICGKNWNNEKNVLHNPSMIIATVNYRNRVINTDKSWIANGKPAVELGLNSHIGTIYEFLKQFKQIDINANRIWDAAMSIATCVEKILP